MVDPDAERRRSSRSARALGAGRRHPQARAGRQSGAALRVRMSGGGDVNPLNEWTASEIAAAVAAGRTTREAVMRACLDRITAREAEVQAWTNLDPRSEEQ